ncbi:protein kinase-like domain, Phloem protein 2-like protein [Artemisia annua]|uniref:non-specific serine/threonine protein kinase n=1 Tax=Artemisia annua TaxID=35608 RepID=A0A2U1MZ07_ARTAN|nr:protein kinase-like domain, Phloem protein 2-like protein [Artemisia annua]
MSSVNHGDLAHLKIPLESIQSATNNFDEENLIHTSGFEKRYWGQLLWSGELLEITARRFSEGHKDRDELFWTEVSMLFSLKHKNLVTVLGFCDEKGEKIIIVNKHETARGRLDNYLSDPLLTWVRRLEICVGLARALSYIHYDEPRDFSVIHRNINSATVLLNDDWEPKLSNFECSLKIKASQRHHSFHNETLQYTDGYGDPTYIETKSANHKSDIYSFGIVMFELLCGRREAVIADNSNKYLAPLAITHYREKTLYNIVDPDLWKQMDPQSFNIFAETAYSCLNEERSQRPNIDEIVTRLEKASGLQLEREKAIQGSTSISTSISRRDLSHVYQKPKSFHKDLSHLKHSFHDIASATNNFDEENIIRTFRFGIIYKGHLLHSEQFIDIIVKRFLVDYVKDESKRFWTEVSMLSSLKHKNLVSIIGFSNDEEKIIIYKKEANRSLKTYLSDQTLTWMQRLKICIGIAKALNYIHYDAGRDFSVIHCNIRSSKVFLDDQWEPKLSGFEISLKSTVAQRHHLLLTRDIVKNVYLDPKYEETGGVTHKSDVYSFGVVLFEVLCRRSAILPDEEGILSHLANSHLDDMIDEHLRNQMDQEALKIFSETAYCCIKEERADRPYIDQVVKRLEKALKLQLMYENPELPMNADDGTSSNYNHLWILNHLCHHVSTLLLFLHLTSFCWVQYGSIKLQGRNLEHLRIGLNDIKEATKNFDDAYCIGSGGFGKVYKANLEHFDSSNSFLIEDMNKCDLPRKRSTVAIKRIYNREGEEGFIAEIEILTRCKHENIISLLGFSDEGPDHMILVYEHACRGSLADYLGRIDKLINLTWVQRLNICLNIAHGLNYIHNNTDYRKPKIIHRDIKSDNILLGDNWKAKIADFGLSQFHSAYQADSGLSKFYRADNGASTIYTNLIAGTYVYLDPEYHKYGKLNKKTDIYSFGVVLLEILTGSLAYESVYTKVNEKGIAPIARDHFEKGTLMKIVDPKIKEEIDEHVFSLSKGPNKESLDIFSEIAFRCVAETQAQRPTIEVVINELKKALDSQMNHKKNLKISIDYIKQATQNFRQDSLIGYGDSGKVYKGVSAHTLGQNNIAAKRLNRESGQGEAEFVAELDILMEYKHDNVIGLVGYCDEEEEKIIVYEFASRGSLDWHLSDASLTWVMRLKICIDIAIGLEFLHKTASSQQVVIHRDISSSNILLFDDWKAKITDFGLSLVCPVNQDVDYVIDDVKGTIGYCDPLYETTGFLTKESDIFSLGAVLFDLLCGKLSSVKLDDEYQFLPFLAKHRYQVGKLDELVFEGIKEQIVPQSYITFTRIALKCLHHRRERRPTADEVVIQLKKALEFQEDYEMWEPKLPKDYKEIIQMSKCPEIYFSKKKEELYNTFTKGILLQHDKVILSFDGDGERNVLVSATTFTYVNSCPHKWRSLKESRFEKVAEMSDIFNLNIEIKTDTQLLTPKIVYGVYLVFKLCDSRKFSTKRLYVNLKYRKESETLQAYFATQRDENWMMIELYRFLHLKEDVVFKFLLESFSSCYWGDGAIYVEGIEFRAIDKETSNKMMKIKTNYTGMVFSLEPPVLTSMINQTTFIQHSFEILFTGSVCVIMSSITNFKNSY